MKQKPSTQHIPMIFRPLFTSDRLDTRQEALLLILLGGLMSTFFVIFLVGVLAAVYLPSLMSDPVMVEGIVQTIEPDGCSCTTVTYVFEVVIDTGTELIEGHDTIHGDVGQLSANYPISITYSASNPSRNIITNRNGSGSNVPDLVGVLGVFCLLSLYMFIGGIVGVRSGHSHKPKRGIDI